MLSAFSLAWTVGLVVPGAPGGLGVFEAFLLLNQQLIVPEESLVVTLLFYRLVSSLADACAALMASYPERKLLKES